MFKNKKKDNDANSAAPNTAASGSTNTITAGTSVEGTIHANNDIRIDGELTGTLNCKGRVIIGGQGKVQGDIVCQNAIIEGKFSGNLKVEEILTVKESAMIEGEIVTGKLNIQPGAIFNGNCSMGGQKLKSISLADKKQGVV